MPLHTLPVEQSDGGAGREFGQQTADLLLLLPAGVGEPVDVVAEGTPMPLKGIGKSAKSDWNG